ncbi:hypothetical protein RIF29_25154 [Crotalaria pallida]|uniref:Uncharacterized protein n=1 Tax=Crotalaria pallida TaxID=3830 RepID=A0AAN9ER28_CROPI
MFRLMRMLQGLQSPLRLLNSIKFKDIDKKESVCRANLLRAQAALADDPLNINLQKAEKAANQELGKVSEAAILFLKQKAKEHWLKNGDQNTSYFHSVIKYKRYKSRILSLEEYHTAKAALETGASLAPGESRVANLIKECDTKDPTRY